MKRLLLVLAAASAVFAVHCSAQEPSASTSESGLKSDGVPCAVHKVLAERCLGCHGDAPKFGAPMSLASWADAHARADRIGARIHDARAPMPPGAPLSADERAVLDDWIGKGAPRTGEVCSPTTTSAPVTPEALPCAPEERETFTAHAAGIDEPFDVPVDAGNLQQCFTWRAKWSDVRQATAFAPILGDARVLHHWILFDTATPQVEGGAKRCEMPNDARFLMGWAPGGKGAVLPPDVGLELPTADRWLILQVHYWNAARHADVRDRSGVAMCTTKPGAPRPITAVVSTLGSLAIDLPPRSRGIEVTSHCRPELDQPVHIMGAGPHMHRYGRKFRTDILRGGRADDLTNVTDVQQWDFEAQTGQALDVVVNPGDVLRTTCTFDNDSDQRVRFGERTEDEMCFNFVTVWPAPGLHSGTGAKTRRCFGR